MARQGIFPLRSRLENREDNENRKTGKIMKKDLIFC